MDKEKKGPCRKNSLGLHQVIFIYPDISKEQTNPSDFNKSYSMLYKLFGIAEEPSNCRRTHLFKFLEFAGH